MNSQSFLVPLYHSTLGFDRLYDEIEKFLDHEYTKSVQKTTSFPPHNILKLDDNRYVVEIAVAGFGKNDIDVTVQDGVLTIKGEKKEKSEGVTYLHRGIGTRSFTKTLTIADTVEVCGAAYEDGVLRIALENVIPDHKKPRKIEIGDELKAYSPSLLTE